jgi:hypothetical protein
VLLQSHKMGRIVKSLRPDAMMQRRLAWPETCALLSQEPEIAGKIGLPHTSPQGRVEYGDER